MTHMTPTRLIDMHADLIDRCRDTRFLSVLRASYRLDFGGDLDPHDRDRRLSENAKYATDAFVNHARAAHVYNVTEDMSSLVQHMAGQLDETDQFDARMAPTGCGLVHFDRPLPIIDVRGQTMLCHWMLWGAVQVHNGYGPQYGVMVTTFNDNDFPDEVFIKDDQTLTEEQRAFKRAFLGRWAWIGSDLLDVTGDLGPAEVMPGKAQQDNLLRQGVTPVAATSVNRYVMALWMLLNQTIVQVTEEEPDRAGRRRATRMNIPSRVTVIQLRRSESAVGREPGESLVQWTHRWLVRRHWRWQPRGARTADHVHALAPAVAEDGHMVRRCVIPGCDKHEVRISIAAHVKGPEGAPLIVSDKLYSLER